MMECFCFVGRCRWLFRKIQSGAVTRLKEKVVNQNYPVMTFGESKGLTFDRVLIYQTTPMVQWIFDRRKELKNQSRSKFYVAVTRAKYSVAIVLDNTKNQVADGISEYKV